MEIDARIVETIEEKDDFYALLKNLVIDDLLVLGSFIENDFAGNKKMIKGMITCWDVAVFIRNSFIVNVGDFLTTFFYLKICQNFIFAFSNTDITFFELALSECTLF